MDLEQRIQGLEDDVLQLQAEVQALLTALARAGGMALKDAQAEFALLALEHRAILEKRQKQARAIADATKQGQA